MAPLVAELERAGFCDVATIAQTGNVLVTTELAAPAAARAVEAAVLASSGTTTVAMSVTAADLQRVLDAESLSDEDDPSRVLAVVLDRDPPADADLGRLDPGRTELVGRILVQRCPDGVSKAPSAVAFVERHWGLRATARNLRMIRRIAAGLG